MRILLKNIPPIGRHSKSSSRNVDVYNPISVGGQNQGQDVFLAHDFRYRCEGTHWSRPSCYIDGEGKVLCSSVDGQEKSGRYEVTSMR